MGQGCIVWLTGLSGAGKSTIAAGLAAELQQQGLAVEILDGDIVRENLSRGLGFSKEDRDTNVRRIGFVAGLLARNGVVVIVAAISPYRAIRDEVRATVSQFVEVYVRCSIEELVERDTKGLYQRAINGELSNFTGINDPYEEPSAPEVTADTDLEDVSTSVAKVLNELSQRRLLTSHERAAAENGFSSSNGVPARDQVRENGSSVRHDHPPTNVHDLAPDVERLFSANVNSNHVASSLIAPHGGELINRLADPAESAYWESQIDNLKSLTLDSFQISDVEMIAIGAFSPLGGFMCSDDYSAVISGMRLASGLVWPIPVVLGVRADEAERFSPGDAIALRSESGDFLAILHLEETYAADPELEAISVFKTTSHDHPGVNYLYQRGPVLLGGPVTLVRRRPSSFSEYRMDPSETRRIFDERGWKRVVGFQTRNPVHRAHEYIQKAALETMDGLLLHPLVGETKGDDIPADVRMKCYEVLLEKYYPLDRVILAINPASMRYAGPREAIFHALVRQNYGCTHFIVGRDHAGVGNYYGPFDAQHIFDEFKPGEIGITPLLFDHTYYCRACAGMASAKTCPHDASERVILSGTQVRNLLRDGQPIPLEFTRPEVATILMEAMQRTTDSTVS
jgi:ATP sulfurylase/adenylyl-sulfate kinase